MPLIVEQSLAAGFIPVNTQQLKASLPFKPGDLERKIFNNDDITFYCVLTLAKPSCDNMMRHSPLRDSSCNTLSHSGLANVIHGKECFMLSLKLKVRNIDIIALHLDRTVVTNTFHGAVANGDVVSGCSKVTLYL